jgi:hypothetical protein
MAKVFLDTFHEHIGVGQHGCGDKFRKSGCACCQQRHSRASSFGTHRTGKTSGAASSVSASDATARGDG